MSTVRSPAFALIIGSALGRRAAGARRAKAALPLRVGAVAAAALLAVLAGCTDYRAAPLPDRADLAPALASLDRTIPAIGPRMPARTIDIGKRLTIDDVGLLAVLNDPDLKSERGEIGVGRAALLQESLLPDPTAGLGYGGLVAGPGAAASLAASLAQDIAAIVTRAARVDAAEAHVREVDAGQLWREWQVAQKARQLAVDLYAADRTIAALERERRLIARELARVRGAIAAGNLTLAALSPLLGANATVEEALAGARLASLKNWQALDALLGLVPSARFAIARPQFPPLPRDIDALVAELPNRRPDLAALRLGYRAAEENVRAAVLGQFPAFSIGVNYGSDTSKVVTIGPTFAFALPVFNRNQGHVATARATRQLLREQYQARLDAATADIRALQAQLRRLTADLAPARAAVAAAASLAGIARRAYAQGNLDQRTLTDYETTALERSLQVIAFERQIGEDSVILGVELGLGLPQSRIALSGAPPG